MIIGIQYKSTYNKEKSIVGAGKPLKLSFRSLFKLLYKKTFRDTLIFHDNILMGKVHIIPENVLYHKKIFANAKLLYCVIAFICKQDGCCLKRNIYFAKLFGVSITSISLWIKSLRENKLIQCEVRQKYMRVIFLHGTSKDFVKEVLRKLKDNTTYYMRERISDAHAVDDFEVETKEWIGKDGVRCGRDSIDYE